MFGRDNNVQKDLEYFVIFDSKVDAYDEPVAAINQHDLIRGITNMFMDPQQQQKNKLFINAEDYSIFKIGSYAKKTGTFSPQTLERVAYVHELKALALRKIAENGPQSGPMGIGST